MELVVNLDILAHIIPLASIVLYQLLIEDSYLCKASDNYVPSLPRQGNAQLWYLIP